MQFSRLSSTSASPTLVSLFSYIFVQVGIDVLVIISRNRVAIIVLPYMDLYSGRMATPNVSAEQHV